MHFKKINAKEMELCIFVHFWDQDNWVSILQNSSNILNHSFKKAFAMERNLVYVQATILHES